MTNRSEQRTVTIPLHVWGRLASEADQRGVRVEDILVAAINSVLKRSLREAVVVGLAVAGHPDRVISELTGNSPKYVRQARKSAGIKRERERA